MSFDDNGFRKIAKASRAVTGFQALVYYENYYLSTCLAENIGWIVAPKVTGSKPVCRPK